MYTCGYHRHSLVDTRQPNGAHLLGYFMEMLRKIFGCLIKCKTIFRYQEGRSLTENAEKRKEDSALTVNSEAIIILKYSLEVAFQLKGIWKFETHKGMHTHLIIIDII